MLKLDNHNAPPHHSVFSLLLPLAFASLLALFWFLCIKFTGLEAELAENNYQANAIRLSNYLYGEPPQAVLVGTSIAGRLLPEYFAEAGLKVANLGMDGAVPLTGLEIIHLRTQNPQLILLEDSILDRLPTANDQQLLSAVDSTTFQIARFIPVMQPDYRPSSVAYTALKKWRDRTIAGIPGRANDAPPTPTGQRNNSNQLRPIKDRLQPLLDAGCKVIIVHIPNRYLLDQSRPTATGKLLATELNVPHLDLAAIMAKQGDTVRYSDGLHLVAPSAKLASRRLTEYLLQQQVINTEQDN